MRKTAIVSLFPEILILNLYTCECDVCVLREFQPVSGVHLNSCGRESSSMVPLGSMIHS